MAYTIRRFILNAGGAFIAGILILGIPTLLVPKNVVPLTSDLGNVSVGFLQLAALYFPALAIFSQLLLEFSYRKGEIDGKSGGVGKFGPNVFRWGVILTAGVSSLFLILGVASIILALELPAEIEAGVALIMIGMIFAPMMLVYVAVLEFSDI